MNRPSRLALLFSSLSILPACSTPGAPPAPTSPAVPVVPAVPTAPVTPVAPPAPRDPAPRELTFAAQPGWREEPPSSSMRRAQYVLPGADGAAEATLVVYYFGAGGGGGIEANVTRWAGQFEQPDGSDSLDALERVDGTLHDLDVTYVSLSGTYVAETSPGSGEHVNEDDWSLRAAILDAPEGAYYLKLVGPAATVARWESSWTAFLEAVGR